MVVVGDWGILFGVVQVLPGLQILQGLQVLEVQGLVG